MAKTASPSRLFHSPLLLGGAALLCLVLPTLAQEVEKPTSPDMTSSKDKLRGVEQQIEKSSFEQRRLAYEIEHLNSEAQKIRLSLVETAKKVRAIEESIAQAESKLADISGREMALRRSLASREKVTGEILAAMQRIGRKPPPAVLVQPEDVLGAMRAAILLGAIVPDLRDEAMILIADLKTLIELRKQAASLSERLQQEGNAILGERNRLAELVEARQSQINLSREQLDSEKTRVASLARDAKSLRELISRSETEMIGSARAIEIAKRAPAPQRSGTDMASLGADTAREAMRLAPRTAFMENRGKLNLPVSGTLARSFGQSDGLGGTERGITMQTGKDAIVTAPADGWVHFAAPYRGYGHLLIMNAGNGYHIVLAGMARLTVEIGQFVLAGEPIGQIGVSSALPASDNLATARPALYVEFRKDGSPIDPSPWWHPQSAEKARG